MKTNGIKIGIAVAALNLLSFTGFCATPGYVETWSGTDTAGWERFDPLNKILLPMTNTAGYLEVSFGQQGMSMPEVHIVRAVAGSSGGAFTGSYIAGCVTNVAFRFFCGNFRPDELRLYFHNGATDDWWYYPLAIDEAGTWTAFNVSLDCWKGWRMGKGVRAGQMRTDLAGVDWIGLQIQRNGSTEQQSYGIDDFRLDGVDIAQDSDSDGMKDWHEFIAGTDPNDPNDSLLAALDFLNGRATLRWKSIGNRWYGVWRDTNLLDEIRWPSKIATGMEATPPINIFTDETASGKGPYYYRIELEE